MAYIHTLEGYIYIYTKTLDSLLSCLLLKAIRVMENEKNVKAIVSWHDHFLGNK